VNTFPSRSGIPFDTNYQIICFAKEGRLDFEGAKFFCSYSYLKDLDKNPLREQYRRTFSGKKAHPKYVFGPPPEKKKLTVREGRKLIPRIKNCRPETSDEESEAEIMKRQRICEKEIKDKENINPALEAAYSRMQKELADEGDKELKKILY
jgi:hypothetical protein